MRELLALGFWGAAAALLYAYAGFPLLVGLAGRLRDRRVRKGPVVPHLSVLIAAYNEEEEIHDRIDNVLAADYPPDRREVIVASDGSTDATAAIVSRFADRGVRSVLLPRRGKIHALDEAVRRARGEVLVFTDANTRFDRGALRAIARNFADPEVGGVAGNTGYVIAEGSESSSRGERLYWRYDTWLKEMESRTGSVVSAHGGLYAIRRDLYRTPPDPGATDDFIISTAVIDQGRRLVFEPEARAWERTVARAAPEFRRRVRLMTRGLRSVWLRRRLLDPFRTGFYALVLFSHKILRRLLPLALLALLASSLVLGLGFGARFYLVAGACQLAFYLLATAGWALRGSRIGGAAVLYVPFFYVMANAAGLLALSQFVRGRRIERWEPQRHEGSGAASGLRGPPSAEEPGSGARSRLAS